MVRRRLPLVGSNGPSCSVSPLRINPAPIPSPVFVKMPGAARSVGTVPREGKFSELVTMTSAVPISVCGGTRKLTCVDETKKICAVLAFVTAPEKIRGKLNVTIEPSSFNDDTTSAVALDGALVIFENADVGRS